MTCPYPLGCCGWSLTAHAPNADRSGRVPIADPFRCPRNRWQALWNRLDHAGYADWPRLCCHAAAGHPL